MELALSLGDYKVQKPLSFLHEKNPQKIIEKDLGFCMAVGKLSSDVDENNGKSKETGLFDKASSSDPPVQRDLLPFYPVHKTRPSTNKSSPFNWLTQNSLIGEPGREMLEANRSRLVEKELKADQISSSNTNSFKMDFSIILRGNRDFESIKTNNIISDEEEEENVISRKKLRLTKEQSAFLEESFKQHYTLNPKQKLGIAKQLNLRPRQVEVWFQNRRARTKLKQTEVDCEYLKRYSETLREENRRLQKELQELRALKAYNSKPAAFSSPATTLTMCPSCQRVATTTTAAARPATPAAAKLMPKTEVFV